MPERPTLEVAGAITALLLSVAFIASFAFGIGRAGPRSTDAVTDVHAIDVPLAAGRIEVLNGSGRSGMARAVTHRLRNAGFDVVFFGNAPASASGTVARAQAGDRCFRYSRQAGSGPCSGAANRENCAAKPSRNAGMSSTV